MSVAIEQMADDIYQVRIPIPVPLRYINAYLLKGSRGWTVVDCGVHDKGTEGAWRQVAAELGFGPGDVEAIFVTHLHLDHYGAAGWLQNWLDAPVLLGAGDAALIDHLWTPAFRPWATGDELSRLQGIPPAVRQVMWNEWELQSTPLILPQPRLTPVEDGAVLELGGRRWQAICLPGHSDGLMVLWDEVDKILLAADMVLVKITPAITVWRGCDPDPLGNYLQSLRRVSHLPARRVLPGHRAEIMDLAGRVAELQQHHRERLACTHNAVVESGPGGATVWELSRALFSPQTDPYGLRFATGEAAAHAEYLVRQEQLIRRVDDQGVMRYTLPH